MNDFKSRLHDLRKERGLSGDSLAILVKTTRFSISNWETGKSQPSLEQIIQLARVFNVSTDYLLGVSEVTGTIMMKKIQSLTPEELHEVDDYIEFIKNKHQTKDK